MDAAWADSGGYSAAPQEELWAVKAAAAWPAASLGLVNETR